MKKYLLIIAPVLLLFASCAFDDEEVQYPVTKVLFTYQTYNRQLVVGEGLELDLGVVYSGVLSNKSDKVVQYQIKESMVPAGKYALPSSYYTCADATNIIVPKGSLKGYMTVKLDSLKFVSDERALNGSLILAVKIVSAQGVDQVASGKDSTLISVSYHGKQFGNYTYNGTRTSTAGTTTYKNVPTTTNSIRQLQTAGPDKFLVYPDQIGSNDPNKGRISFFIQVPVHGGGNVTITPNPTSTIAVQADGTSTYDEATKTFTLNYKFTDNGTEYKVSDVMVFRNRIRDDQGDGRVLHEWRGF